MYSKVLKLVKLKIAVEEKKIYESTSEREALGRTVALELAVIPILTTLLADRVRGESLPEMLESIEEMRLRARSAVRSLGRPAELQQVIDQYVETLFNLVASSAAAAAFEADV